jgi:predicted enzyme related to lactoylglutathione lyase
LAVLYPSWIEIPAADLERALRFYRGVFELTDTPLYHEPPMQIAVLLPSDKSLRNPGVSLVYSPTHKAGDAGPQVKQLGGVRYITLLDSEGNRIALSSYEPLDDDGE